MKDDTHLAGQVSGKVRGIHQGNYQDCLEPGCYLPAEQPDPVPNDSGSIQQLVIADMAKREKVGIARYGTSLQIFNGRDALRDLYEELLDACCYVRQAIEERQLSGPLPEGDGPYFTAADLALHLETGQPVVPSGMRRSSFISPERAAWQRQLNDSVTSD